MRRLLLFWTIQSLFRRLLLSVGQKKQKNKPKKTTDFENTRIFFVFSPTPPVSPPPHTSRRDWIPDTLRGWQIRTNYSRANIQSESNKYGDCVVKACHDKIVTRLVTFKLRSTGMATPKLKTRGKAIASKHPSKCVELLDWCVSLRESDWNFFGKMHPAWARVGRLCPSGLWSRNFSNFGGLFSP